MENFVNGYKGYPNVLQSTGIYPEDDNPIN